MLPIPEPRRPRQRWTARCTASRTSSRLAALGRQGAVAAAFGLALSAAAPLSQGAPLPTAGLNEPGPENAALAPRAGTWDVTETVWDTPTSAPVTTTGLVAERRVIGQVLQEVVHPLSDAAMKDIRRIDYLSFQRVEGRWKYVSMDMRAPVGIMGAQSLDRGDPTRIDIAFAPFAIAGAGQESSGQMFWMTQTIAYTGADSDTKDQYFILADGSGKKWLAHRYAYRRRP